MQAQPITAASFDIDPVVITPEDIRALCGRDDPTVLDVGSNNGHSGRSFYKTMPDAKLYAFEPDPRAIAKWKQVMAGTSAQLFETAIGAHDGAVTFYQSGGEVNERHKDWDLSGSIRRPKEHLRLNPQITFDRAIEVPIKRLDTWSAEQRIAAVDFIWADLQGAELEMIAGAGRLLKNTRYVYLEYSEKELYEGQPTLQNLVDALPDHEIIRIWRDDVLFARKPA